MYWITRGDSVYEVIVYKHHTDINLYKNGEYDRTITVYKEEYWINNQ